MAWVAVDEDKSECVCDYKPQRFMSIGDNRKAWDIDSGDILSLPKGSIEKLIGRKLTWEDEPVELKEDE